MISRLRELGVSDITGFERYDDVGGTWHPKLSYHSIQIHGAMWITSFDRYPYNPTDRDANDGKVLGSEAHAYVRRFTKDKDVKSHYRFNSKVVSIKYNSAKRNAVLVVEDPQGQCTESGPFDFVIYAASPTFPTFQDKLLSRARFFTAFSSRPQFSMRS